MAATTFTDRGTLITPEELPDLESDCGVSRFPAGSILMGEGETTTFTLYILKGYATIVVQGRPQQIHAIREPGETVGEMAAITEAPRSASVFAFDDVQALYIPGSRWLRFLAEHPRANLALSYLLSQRVNEATQRTVTSLLGAEQKLAKAMDKWSHLGQHTPDGISLGFSQQELANLAGISVDSVKQVIRSFKDRDLITTGWKRTVVKDLKTLRAIAQGDSTASAR